MGIHEKKSTFIRPGYSFTIKAKIAKANIEAVNTSPEQTNIILALTFLMKNGVTPKRNMTYWLFQLLSDTDYSDEFTIRDKLKNNAL